MDRNEVMRLARGAGCEFGQIADGMAAMCTQEAFWRFVDALETEVAAAERDWCAKVCDAAFSDDPLDSIAWYLADTIRARGKKHGQE